MAFFRKRPFLSLYSKFSILNSSGFTILELLVVVGLSMFLMGTTIAYNRSLERHLILFQEQARVVGVIQKAKSLTLGAYGVVGQVICGYGVAFSLDGNMRLFRDLPSGPDCSTANGIFAGAGTSEEIEVVKVDTVAVRFRPLPLSQIFFVPPQPRVTILDPVGTSIPDALIEIETIDGVGVSGVRLNDLGQIAME